MLHHFRSSFGSNGVIVSCKKISKNIRAAEQYKRKASTQKSNGDIMFCIQTILNKNEEEGILQNAQLKMWNKYSYLDRLLMVLACNLPNAKFIISLLKAKCLAESMYKAD